MILNNTNFKDIESNFCFLDETGLIFGKRDKYFAIGLIECNQPELIYNKIRKIRQKYNYNEEIKWTNLNSEIRLRIAMEVFNCFIKQDGVRFNCLILDKEELDFLKEYDNNLSKVYRNFSISLLKLVMGKKPQKIFIILADDYFTPENLNIEVTIKKFINCHYQDFIVAGVCQINSKSSDLLQLTDLILGVVIYDLKIVKNLLLSQGKYKKRFLKFVHQKLKIQNSFFINNSRQSRNYVLSGDKLRATIFDSNRSIVKKRLNQTKTGHGPQWATPVS